MDKLDIIKKDISDNYNKEIIDNAETIILMDNMEIDNLVNRIHSATNVIQAILDRHLKGLKGFSYNLQQDIPHLYQKCSTF